MRWTREGEYRCQDFRAVDTDGPAEVCYMTGMEHSLMRALYVNGQAERRRRRFDSTLMSPIILRRSLSV